MPDSVIIKIKDKNGNSPILYVHNLGMKISAISYVELKDMIEENPSIHPAEAMFNLILRIGQHIPPGDGFIFNNNDMLPSADNGEVCFSIENGDVLIK